MTEQIRKELMKEFIKNVNDFAKKISTKPQMVKKGNLKYIIWKIKNNNNLKK